jgi:ATP-dependent 26S proteasome regulatory subunit
VEAERLQLLKRLTSGLQLSGKLELVARQTKGTSFADIACVCTEVAKISVLNENAVTDTKVLLKLWRDWTDK